MDLLHPGDSFGELALLTQDPHEFTIRAEGEVAVLVISRDAFDHLCGSLEGRSTVGSDLCRMPSMMDKLKLSDSAECDESYEPERPKIYQQRRPSVYNESLSLSDSWVPPSYPHSPEENERLRDYMRKTVLLSHLAGAPRDNVVCAFEKKEFPAGTEIISQGGNADYYYILDSGHLEVWRSANGGPQAKVFEYTSGGAFGELALLYGEPRQATVRATVDCVCWALDRLTFRRIMMAAGRNHMEERVRLLGALPMLKDMTQFERFKIAEAMEVRHVAPGGAIVLAGMPATELYVVLSGVCRKLPPA